MPGIYSWEMAGRGRAGASPASAHMETFWSDASMWVAPFTPSAGAVPTTNDTVIIPAGRTVILDVDTASIGSLTIAGTLKNSGNANISITSTQIALESTGRLEIGTEGTPYTGQAFIELTGAEASRAARFVPDVTASGGTGNGTLNRLAASTGAVAETITVTWSDATNFSVSGSISGSLGSGTNGTLFNNKVRFYATAGSTAWTAGATRTISVVTRGFTNSGLPRMIHVADGAVLSLVGNAPSVVRTRLNADAAISDTSITLADSVTWKSGDQIVIGPTDFTTTTSGVAESLTLNSDVTSSTSVPLTSAVTRYKWGKMQYVTDTGMSLTAGTLTKPSSIDQAKWDLIPKTLDERAAVINLTRNIKFRGINDSAWSTSKFGAHIMIHGITGRCHLNGVEFTRVGQAGAIGRYPIHFHMNSYNMPDGENLPSDGTFVGATTHSNHYVKNCSVHNSGQRAIVIHGCHGVLLQKNVCYDITGHAIFLEDGSEESNTIDQNAVIQVNVPTSANKLIDSDVTAGNEGQGTTCYWLTNPYNTITDNWGFGGQSAMWNAFAGLRCFNLSQEVAIVPNTRPVQLHSGNIAACNVGRGFVTEVPPSDNKGSVSTVRFFAGSLVDGSRFTFTSNQTWKNVIGYTNRVNQPGFYNRWTAADNKMIDFSGQADQQVILDMPLLVGVSLNNGNSAETTATNNRRAAFISYDEGFVPTNILAVNYPVRDPPAHSRDSFAGQVLALQGGGLVRMGEYIWPIWTFTYYGPWHLIGSTPGYMVSPPHFDGEPITSGSHKFTLGICYDVTGLFTGTPGRSVVYNDPFYTTDATDLQSWSHAEAKHTSSRYIGLKSVGAVSGIYTSNYFTPQQPFYVDREDSGGTIVGSWHVPDSRTDGSGLSHFKHAGLMRGGIYRVGWNGEIPSGTTVSVSLALSEFFTSSDTVTLGVTWPNAVTVGTIYLRFRGDGIPSALTQFELDNSYGSPPLPLAVKFNNTGMTSRADVIADTTGLKYWQDTTNNVVWIKLKGGLIYDEQATRPDGRLNPHRAFGLAIWESVLP